jgi:hypothetical protein
MAANWEIVKDWSYDRYTEEYCIKTDKSFYNVPYNLIRGNVGPRKGRLVEIKRKAVGGKMVIAGCVFSNKREKQK